MNVFLMSPTFDEKAANAEEPYYEAKYKKELLKEGSGKTPLSLVDQGRVEVWWQGMNAVQLPKGDVQLKLGFSSELTKSIEGVLFASLHSRLANRILEAPTDELQMCGLSFGISAAKDG